MKKNILLILISLLAISCSSVKKSFNEDNHSSLSRDYKVIDSNYEYRPGWIDYLSEWTKKTGSEGDYFSKESIFDDRELSCADAKSEVFLSIAESSGNNIKNNYEKEINNSLGYRIKRVSQKLENKVDTKVRDVSLVERYWEKREYQDGRVLYSCAVLVKK